MSDTTGTATSTDATGADLRTKFEAQLAAKDRELSIIKAMPWADSTKPVVAAFIRDYNGELTPDALTAAAADWGIVAPAPAAATTDEAPPPPPAPPATTATAAEQSQTSDRLGLGAEGTGTGQIGQTDPRVAGMEAFHASLAAGNSREDASAEFVDRIIAGAVSGDKRVLFDRAAHQAAAGN